MTFIEVVYKRGNDAWVEGFHKCTNWFFEEDGWLIIDLQDRTRLRFKTEHIIRIESYPTKENAN